MQRSQQPPDTRRGGESACDDAPPPPAAVPAPCPQLWELPFLSRLGAFRVQETEAFKKGQQVVEDLKEKYETSDHPMVHKVRPNLAAHTQCGSGRPNATASCSGDVQQSGQPPALPRSCRGPAAPGSGPQPTCALVALPGLSWVTSRNPQVDEMRERILSGSESSRAMLEVRLRDPNFDLNTFVRAIKVSALTTALPSLAT